MNADQTLRDLVALPGPPGQEDRVRDYVVARLETLGLTVQVDAKGNVLAGTPATLTGQPRVVVTAHLDEIALMVKSIDGDGIIGVVSLGGAFPWKWGEGPVEILARNGVMVPGLLSLGSIHTTAPESVAQQARDGIVPGWNGVRILTGQDAEELADLGVRPGSRVVIARSRREIFALGGGLIASYFLDDRADLLALLLAVEATRGVPAFEGVLWAATASEEVGGEGALYLLGRLRPDVCVALEIGPSSPDSPFPIGSQPTVWVSDTYAATDPRDLDLIDDAARDTGLSPYFHVVTRGGSDASCAAAQGLCARPVTLAFAAENSHGFEIMHREAPQTLALLLVAYLRRLLGEGTG